MSPSLTRRAFIQSSLLSAASVALGATAASNAAEAAGEGVAQLKIPDPTQFRILQFTDLHFFAGAAIAHKAVNRRSCQIMRDLAESAKPDLLMVTGDLWPEDRGGMGETSMRAVIEWIEELDLPWAFTWGNHDQLPDYAVGHEAFTKAKNSLYRGAKSEGHYVIDILGPDGQRVWQILCLNSRQDGLLAEQQQWLRSLDTAGGPGVPRLAFFHIPVKQYADIWDSGAASGIIGENVCLEKEDGSTLPILASMGVKACFCGHDHVNDYSGMASGVELVYGRATGAGGYGGKLLRKGGKLITVNCETDACEWLTLLPGGGQWHSAPGEQIDRRAKKK